MILCSDIVMEQQKKVMEQQNQKGGSQSEPVCEFPTDVQVVTDKPRKQRSVRAVKRNIEK